MCGHLGSLWGPCSSSSGRTARRTVPDVPRQASAARPALPAPASAQSSVVPLHPATILVVPGALLAPPCVRRPGPGAPGPLKTLARHPLLWIIWIPLRCVLVACVCVRG
ncbi:hypothetical protein FOCC_FOCC004787 [Frankliniella occidentalis]|nr:hypothetical protein FOCC_FOCC004787 [Frankliniella occidentalis]